MEQHIQGGEREGEQGDKKECWRSQGDATASFLSKCQGKATGTWQCKAPAAPLIYHRPGPLRPSRLVKTESTPRSQK
jgi:hypothetical protein